MSDQITARGTAAQFKPHPEGQFVGVCCDTIDLGDKAEAFAGQPTKLAHKCVLVFRTGERNESLGEFIDIGREFTVSMNEKANLRKFLEQWRGRPYAKNQIEEGVPLHKLLGQAALLTIAHKESGAGRTYANITACVGVPKQMAGSAPEIGDYQRADYWGERRKEYAEGVRQFRAEHAATNGHDDADPDETQSYDDDRDLPF